MKLREGNLFTEVCHSVHGRGVSLVPGPFGEGRSLVPDPFEKGEYLVVTGPFPGVGMPGLRSLSGGGWGGGGGYVPNPCYWHLLVATTHTVSKRAVCILLECLLITARKWSLGQGNIFTPVCHSVHRGGVRGCSGGGGGMRCCSGGACMVLFGGGACVVLFRGGMHGFIQGGVHGFIQGGHAWFFQFFRIQWDTVNERAVRILLECILVGFFF